MRTPGQVGYEAMLQRMRDTGMAPQVRELDRFPGMSDEDYDRAVKFINGVWSEQVQHLRDDWEYVAAAILADKKEGA